MTVLSEIAVGHVADCRERAIKDTIYMCRSMIGFNFSKLQWLEGGKLKGAEKRGDRYGISYAGPHKKMGALLDSDSLWKLMLCPRGSYKSSTATGWMVRKIIEDPNVRQLYAMATEREALKKCREVYNILAHNPRVQQISGGLRIERSGSNTFTVRGRTKSGLTDPTIQFVGLESNFTGSHFDIVILDDIVTFLNVKTSEGLESVHDFFAMVQPLLDPGGILLVIGTRYDDGDLYGTILREQSDMFDTLVMGCGMELVFEENGKERLIGEPTFEHLNEDFLLYKLRSMNNPYKWASQYMNECMASGQQLFKREHFKTAVWESWMENLSGVVLTDTATVASEDACFSVVAVVGVDSIHNAYLFDLWVEKAQPPKFVAALCDMYERWRERFTLGQVLMENIGLNRVFRSMIDDECKRRQIHMNIVPVPRGTNEPSKEQRIRSLSLRFEQGRFIVMDSVPRFFNDGGAKVLWDPTGYTDKKAGICLPSGELVRQFVRFPVAGKNDIPDALADLDAVDSGGNRLVRGMGRRSAIRADVMRSRAGKKIHITLPGFEDPHSPSGSAGHWSKMASHFLRGA